MNGRDGIPFFLHEAVVTLYPAAADGTSLTDLAVWSGALANQMKIHESLEGLKIAGSGERYATEHHIDEDHLIEIERTWILRKQFLRDFMPARNQQYVLELVWFSAGIWYKRTYFGVTGRTVTLESRGTNQFVLGQTFRAQSMQETDGTTNQSDGTPDGGGAGGSAGDNGGNGGSVFTPTPGAEQSIGFFREDPFVNGEYLLGAYRWAADVVLNSAMVIGSAGQGAATVLTLEVGGVLTAKTITIAAGDPNVETTVAQDLAGYIVPAGQSVRWKITSGPIPEAAMWMAALTMSVN